MNHGATLTRLSAEDIFLFPEDGNRHEIIDGDPYMTPPPGVPHQSVSGQLFVILFQHARAHDLGKVFHAPTGVILGKHSGVQPDIVFVSKERGHLIAEDAVRGAPDLVVEILSPSTRDRDLELKRQAYERAGVREYWIVDPKARTVEILALSGRRYRQIAKAGPDGTVEGRVFHGLMVAVRDLFA